MPPVPYPPGQSDPVEIDPMDPEEVAVVSFDWGDWLTEVSQADVDESTFTISEGGSLGDGTAKVIGGKMVAPPAPALTTPVATAHVYIDPADVDDVLGKRITVSNHVRAGNLTNEKSATILVKQH